MIFRNYFLINLVLLILISFLGLKAFNALRVSVDLPLEARPAEVKQESVPIAPKIGFPGEPVFQVISDRNIFSPTRALPVKKTDNVLGQAVSSEVPKLFGTLIIGSSKSAMLKDPETKNTKRYFINDTIGDFVIKDIHEEGVVLLRGDETIEIKLRDDKGATKTTIPTSTIRERKIMPDPNTKIETPTRVGDTMDRKLIPKVETPTRAEDSEEDPNVIK
ncbi:MAG: hypothetical protein Q7U10_07255 [Thermodesulfovibrionia bacterium]|nr:hypothetical protein [Thermodesulfovibrionia bacterium]